MALITLNHPELDRIRDKLCGNTERKMGVWIEKRVTGLETSLSHRWYYEFVLACWCCLAPGIISCLHELVLTSISSSFGTVALKNLTQGRPSMCLRIWWCTCQLLTIERERWPPCCREVTCQGAFCSRVCCSPSPHLGASSILMVALMSQHGSPVNLLLLP